MKISTPVAALAVGLLLTTLLTGCAKPCTDCPDVSGFYTMALLPGNVPTGACGNLEILPAEGVVLLEQTGSDLQLQGWDAAGVLFQNMKVEFEDTYGETIVGEPGQWSLDGKFSESGDRYRADLEARFTRDRDRCWVKAPATLVPD